MGGFACCCPGSQQRLEAGHQASRGADSPRRSVPCAEIGIVWPIANASDQHGSSPPGRLQACFRRRRLISARCKGREQPIMRAVGADRLRRAVQRGDWNSSLDSELDSAGRSHRLVGWPSWRSEPLGALAHRSGRAAEARIIYPRALSAQRQGLYGWFPANCWLRRRRTAVSLQ